MLYIILIAANFLLVGSNVILVILCNFRRMQAEKPNTPFSEQLFIRTFPSIPLCVQHLGVLFNANGSLIYCIVFIHSKELYRK
jgi:hypothetical protein